MLISPILSIVNEVDCLLDMRASRKKKKKALRADAFADLKSRTFARRTGSGWYFASRASMCINRLLDHIIFLSSGLKGRQFFARRWRSLALTEVHFSLHLSLDEMADSWWTAKYLRAKLFWSLDSTDYLIDTDFLFLEAPAELRHSFPRRGANKHLSMLMTSAHARATSFLF